MSARLTSASAVSPNADRVQARQPRRRAVGDVDPEREPQHRRRRQRRDDEQDQRAPLVVEARCDQQDR